MLERVVRRGRKYLEGNIAAFCSALSSAGLVDRLPEKLIDAGSAVAGCGPAFASLFMEALADGGVAAGLPRAKALEYAHLCLQNQPMITYSQA